METVSSQQAAQTQPPQATSIAATTSKNLKTWFEEFKARVSKKSQSSQSTNSDLPTPNDDNTKDYVQAIESSALAGATSTNASTTMSTDNAPANTNPNLSKASTQTKVRSSSFRTRAPSTDNIDFGAKYFNQSASRRNSNFDTTRKKRQPTVWKKLIAPFWWIVEFVIPFNGTLPWKLLCLINTCFVIIAIGLASGSSQASTALNFFSGFIGGILVSAICFIALGFSFVVYALPRSPDNGDGTSSDSIYPKNDHLDASTLDKTVKNEDYLSVTSVDDSVINNGTRDVTGDSRKEMDSDDFSLFEILDQETSLSGENASRHLVSKLDDDDYKGWMIEFIGDYEQRNSSEIKLKSIFVKIENRILYLCKPKNNHDIDSNTLPTIANQRVYDLNNVLKFSVYLLIPKNVRNKQKYVWSKKYPIKLEFQETNSETVKVLGKTTNETVANLKLVQLTLFAKSCRGKEEWFRRFKRIVEDNLLSKGPGASVRHMTPTKSDETTSNVSNTESLFDSFRRFRRRSPSPKRDSVQTSKSSHLLNNPKRAIDELIGFKKSERESESSSESSASASLVRTKSCELLESTTRAPSRTSGGDGQSVDDEKNLETEVAAADDSTLTKETAESFSQAIEYSNFIDSQPTIDYMNYIEHFIQASREATSTCDWFNALTGRIFLDVFSHNYWSLWFKRKIQRKLYRIRLPYFMETLTLTKIDLGTNAPQFLNVDSHRFDSDGLSIDFDMSYSGGLTMTFETKLNLLKIKNDNQSRNENSNNLTIPCANGTGSSQSSTVSLDNSSLESEKGPTPAVTETICKEVNVSINSDSSSVENINKESHPSSSFTKPQVVSSSASCGSSMSDSDDSDSDSSSESSIDAGDVNEISDWEDYGAEKTRQNIVRFVDRIASSRYFQHATENRYIKKKLQDLSNCPLVLVVKIQSLNGVLTLNVPPPQTDRIWYGFQPNPELVLKALPKMGDREVSLSPVTDWIERKLAEEFKKILVIPNMEDIVLPVLKSDHLQYVTATR